jgi:imidazolonepropionase-like amidohydrolase
MILTTLLLPLAMGAGTDLAASAAPAAELTVFADIVYTGNGQALENAAVVISGGKITAISPGASAKEGDTRVAAITPGMVDLSARLTGYGAVEENLEVTPDFRVANTLDLFGTGWDRHLESGVTTVMVHPFDNNCIGGLSVVLKTGGSKSVEQRTVKADAALRGALGRQPSSKNHPASGRPTDFYSRRPTTRMGVEWEWRKAMYDALYAEGELDDSTKVLRRALDGELTVVAQAWATQDIRTIVYLKEEMAGEGKPKMKLIVDAGAEAWREPQLLVRTGTSVILPPYAPNGRTTDSAFYPMNSAKKLTDLGVPVALSSHSASEPGALLGAQAGFAQRGGMTFDEALAAVTINPARMAGVDDRVGSIEVGKDADLALWNGTPFELSSRVVGVVLDGDLVVAPR